MSFDLHSEFVRILEEIANFDHREFTASLQPDDFPIPTIISDGENGSYPLSKTASEILRNISDNIQAHNPSYQDGYSAEEFQKLIGTCVGAIVSNLSDNRHDWPKNFGQALKEEVELLHTKRCSFRLYFFGAVLVNPPTKFSVNIGPCNIAHRDEWLAKQQSENLISSSAAKRIARIWNGEKLKPLKGGRQNHQEEAILKSIDGCPYVVSVLTNGPSAKQLEERAVNSARLSLVSIALCWQRPTSPMEHFTLAQDRNRKLVYTGSIDTKHKFISYRSRSKHAFPYSAPKADWQDDLPKMQNIFDVIGTALETQCDLTMSASNKSLFETLFQALTLIYRGSIESDPLFATTFFGSAIDMLAGGTGSGGIATLIEKQLGKTKTQALFNDGMTTNQFINKVYVIGRSRTLHGSNPELRKDWSRVRMRAETICRILFLLICDELQRDPTISNLNRFRSLKSN